MSIPVVRVGQRQEDLVGGLERLHGPVTVVRRCTELPELLAACQSGLARAAVIALTGDADEAARLRKIGVASTLASVEAAELSERIADAVAQLTGAARPANLSAAADTGAA